MPSSVEGEAYAVDTSVAVAALDAGHAAHVWCRRAVLEHRPALAGHAAFETYSVLTRMPGPLAIDPPGAAEAIRRLFPEPCWLDTESAASLRARCGPIGIVGGAIYDALVGEAARVNHRRLLTRDHRARRTYDLLGVDHLLVG
ncbi:MAG: type II toxin-antitoxin system VapC family toxin [Acidimicrobiia bacterium]